MAIELARYIDKHSAALRDAKTEIATHVIGQNQVIENCLCALMSGGHALLVGAPGLAKTRLVETIAQVFSLENNRVQFTPDLMPADILGSEVLESTSDGSRNFRFIKGPIFCQLLMADEINRASPRTQSALLQAMQERQVTIAGQDYDLPAPFNVLATQNPIEQEGTYPLPEAQLDRFLFQIDVGLPDRDAERAILLATTGASEADVKPCLDPSALQEVQMLVRQMPVGDAVLDAILNLVTALRPNTENSNLIVWGPGPRASQSLMLAVRARALLRADYAPNLDDVMALAHPVLVHRIGLNFAARADGLTPKKLIQQTLFEQFGNSAGS